MSKVDPSGVPISGGGAIFSDLKVGNSGTERTQPRILAAIRDRKNENWGLTRGSRAPLSDLRQGAHRVIGGIEGMIGHRDRKNELVPGPKERTPQFPASSAGTERTKKRQKSRCDQNLWITRCQSRAPRRQSAHTFVLSVPALRSFGPAASFFLSQNLLGWKLSIALHDWDRRPVDNCPLYSLPVTNPLTGKR